MNKTNVPIMLFVMEVVSICIIINIFPERKEEQDPTTESFFRVLVVSILCVVVVIVMLQFVIIEIKFNTRGRVCNALDAIFIPICGPISESISNVVCTIFGPICGYIENMVTYTISNPINEYIRDIEQEKLNKENEKDTSMV